MVETSKKMALQQTEKDNIATATGIQLQQDHPRYLGFIPTSRKANTSLAIKSFASILSTLQWQKFNMIDIAMIIKGFIYGRLYFYLCYI